MSNLNSRTSEPRSSGISLEIGESTDGSVDLELQAFGEGFLVAGSAYFRIQDIKGFLSELRRFPLGGAPGVQLSGGYFDDTGVTLISENFHISAYQIEPTGLLALSVKVFTPHPIYGAMGLGHGGRCCIFADYGILASFVADFERLLDREIQRIEFRGLQDI